MATRKRFLNINKSIVLSVLLAPVALLPGRLVQASSLYQEGQVKSKIQLELEKKDTSTSASSSKPVKREPERSVRRRGSAPVSRDLSVTFVTDHPGVDIALDGILIGKTGEDKKLTIRVKPGQHKATANLKGYASNTMTISVAADKATHTLKLGKPLPPPAPFPTPVAKIDPPVTPEPVPAPSADEIIIRFIDPNQTNAIKDSDWKEVILQSEEALKKDSKDTQAAARLHLARGQLAYLNRDYAESLTEFNRAIASLPRSGVAYYALGNAYLATNQPVQATKTYERATELTPELSAIANKGIGDALTRLGKHDDANTYYLRARDLGYVSPQINRSIALNLIKQEKWEKALTELTAIERDDTSAELQLYLGECYENLKRPLSAVRAYSEATRIDGNSAIAFAKLGDILYANNEFLDAKDAYERALALDTTGAVINRQQLRKNADKAASMAK